MPKSRLKKGFTTGASAAAAVKAALISYFSNPPNAVDIVFLTGETKTIDVFSVKKIDDNRFEAIIIKDAGDDPDVTHKAQIGASVTVIPSKKKSIAITGGKGVGKITKPGLELPVGEPAINPGPRKMIQQSVDQVFEQFKGHPKQVNIEIFVPKGETLAKKTLNARLGILGGISILGTTGIVTPMSHDAYIATIKSSINVAAANNIDTLVFTTGRRSERFAMQKFISFREEAFIQTGDFFKASLDMALFQSDQNPESQSDKTDKANRNTGIQQIIYTVFFGKAVKMALGFEHTHAAKSELTMKKLSTWAMEITENKQLSQDIKQANTARHAFSYIHPQYPKVISYVGKQIIKNAQRFSGNKLDIRAIIFDFDGNICFDSTIATR